VDVLHPGILSLLNSWAQRWKPYKNRGLLRSSARIGFGRVEDRADHRWESVQRSSVSVILLAVRWYLRYPLAYEHVSELLTERGLHVDRSSIWR
jgi:hypothetical protein